MVTTPKVEYKEIAELGSKNMRARERSSSKWFTSQNLFQATFVYKITY